MLRWALVVLVSVGCARVTFYHPTKTTADFERDKYDCQQIAAAYSANMGAAANPLIIRSEMIKCLKIKYGWRDRPSETYQVSPQDSARILEKESIDKTKNGPRDSVKP